MLKLEDLIVYRIGMEIGQDIWKNVNNWDSFNKWGLGRQLTDAADSIAANIAEGYGRYSFKENKNFCYYSRGSAFETICFLFKARERNIMSVEECDQLINKLIIFLKLLNKYILSIGKNV